MDEKTKKGIELHVAGATVRHRNPFEDLESYKSETEIDKEFIDKWVIPFYMVGLNNTDQFISDLKNVKSDLNIEIAKKLFGDFNWRTRIVGAYFSAIKNYVELEDIIGVHLLKSEVCYAGGGYCLALASFNTEKGIEYLKEYLEYYLTRKDLHFDQRIAMSALNWTDRKNGTNEMDLFLPKYQDWISDKYSQDINQSIAHFDKQIEQLNKIKASS
ncbi:MAG: hypothetical protein GY760_24385 [Deltaproteobacteria bacterium]|nr:hypothetical protein [Deltaproteobacteria bacterium]